MNHQPSTNLFISLPEWVNATVDWQHAYKNDDEKMAFTIELARQNILRGTGGPFGAAIFDNTTGHLIVWV